MNCDENSSSSSSPRSTDKPVKSRNMVRIELTEEEFNRLQKLIESTNKHREKARERARQKAKEKKKSTNTKTNPRKEYVLPVVSRYKIEE